MASKKLSDDILLLIFERTDIDTFLNFRLLSRDILDLVNIHISSLCMSVAHSTFLGNPRMLRLSLQESRPTDISWLKDLRLKQLVAILVERSKPTQGDGGSLYLAEDPGGDLLHQQMFSAFKMLSVYSIRAHDVLRKDPDQLPEDTVQPMADYDQADTRTRGS